MNIVFWLIVVAVAIQLWFFMAPYFKQIGKNAADAFKEAADAMKEKK